MKNKPKVLALIGARSGSKGVPHKNIKLLAGRPLMGWVIEAAKNSKYVDRVIVSTDSVDYQKVAHQFGAETPFLRPSEIAKDTSTDYEYVRHALLWLKENENYEPDIVVRLMPTVPLQEAADIDGLVEHLVQDPEAHSAVVVAEGRQHPEKALKLIDDGKGGRYLVSYKTGEGRGVTPTLRQGYPKSYFRANVVATRPSVVFETETLTGDRVRHVEIPQERAVDIDSDLDFYILEALIEKLGKKKSPEKKGNK
jgi:CMP-N-acetylneuraminic acid synthetase